MLDRRFHPRLLWLVLAVCASACSSGSIRRGEGVLLPSGETFTRVGLLTAFGQCALDNARTFQTSAEALATQASSSATDAMQRVAVQDAWRAALHVWEPIEVLDFGPAQVRSQPGGQDLRNAIYAWPSANRCAIEETLVDQSYMAPSFSTAAFGVRSLYAAEYLLFYEGTDTACPSTSPIVSSGSWAALSPEELAARKLAYVRAIANDVKTNAKSLVDAWDPNGGNFLEVLTSAGTGSLVYRSQQFALNEISDAMFYVYTEVKDMKVGQPAGLADCNTETCLEALESQYAGLSKRHIRDNLLGFRRLYRGCGEDNAGLGFDDYLFAIGAEDLMTQLDEASLASIAAVDAIPEEDLRAAILSDRPAVVALHDSLTTLTDLLKTQFLSILDLEIPQRVEGDND